MYRFASDDEYARARAALAACDYTAERLERLCGRPEVLAIEPEEAERLWAATAAATRLHTAVRMWLLGEPVDRGAAAAALAPLPLSAWSAAGLVADDGDRVHPTTKITPLAGLWVLSDPPDRVRSEGAADFVMGVGQSTLLLSYAALRREVGDALDLGCGAGGLALLNARHAERSLATDINPRAVAVAQFNARLNGLPNVRAAAGDLFAPAAGRQFDLITSNPPFVISPFTRYVFRDSGRRGDEFCRELARAAPALLAEGGYCQMLANCPQVRGQSWQEAWQEWFADLPCDVLVWANQVDPAERYVERWVHDTERDDPAARAALSDQWRRWFAAEQIEAVAYGVITMRRRAAPGWIDIDDAPRELVGPCGEQLERQFRLRDWAATLTADAWLATPFRLAPEARLKDVSGVAEEASAARLVLEGSIRSQLYLDPLSEWLVRRCDGRRPPREWMPAFQAEFALPAAAVAELSADAVPNLLWALVRRGYLLPAAW